MCNINSTDDLTTEFSAALVAAGVLGADAGQPANPDGRLVNFVGLDDKRASSRAVLINFAALNQQLLAEAQTLLSSWLPGGRIRGSEYRCADLSGGRGGSFGVSLKSGKWHDFATGDKGGDLIALYARIHGLGQGAAARELMGLPARDYSTGPARQNQTDKEDSKAKTEYALKLWREAKPAIGTLVATYLQSRGITIPPPLSLRFHPDLKHRSGHRGPVMLAAVQNIEGRIVAIHRTWLRQDGSTQADITPTKMMLGPTSGGAVRFAKATHELVVGEGIETGLSVLQAMSLPTWAALSTSGLRNLHIPDSVTHLWIAVDADSNQAGELAARDAAVRLIRPGRQIKIAKPSTPDTDFNDILLKGTA